MSARSSQSTGLVKVALVVFEDAYGAGVSLAKAMLLMAAANAQTLVLIVDFSTFWGSDGVLFGRLDSKEW